MISETSSAVRGQTTTAGFETSFKASWPYAIRSASADETCSAPTIAPSASTSASCRMGPDYPTSLQPQMRAVGSSPMTEEQQKELAYRFDLFVAPDWGERFDRIVDEHAVLPQKGRILYVNCGTGTRVVDLAASIEEGAVVGTDSDAERIAIARAKAQVSQTERSAFVHADARKLEFPDASFDAVVLDTSLTPPSHFGAQTSEAV